MTRDLGAAMAVLLLAASPSPAQETAAEEAETCLSCHADQQLSVTFQDGARRPLFVDGQALSRSVHGGGAVRCTDCHPGMQEVPHPERTFRDAAGFRAVFADSCKKCHFDKYTKLADGVHYRLLPKGEAPTCSDCHGAHDVSPPGHPRRRVSETCSTCHSDVGEAYAASVHGKALADGGKAQDVPVCTDCHRSHDVAGPHDQSWLVSTPRMCGNCHADEKRMKKYGLSTGVLRTYLADFHGMTASLSHAADNGDQRVTALCSDCHGVHAITRPDDPVAGVRANLVVTCRKCHAGADEKFPSAWLSHYEPSWQKAPLVHAVRLFYRALIPFMIGGLGLQVLLHLWRAVVNR